MPVHGLKNLSCNVRRVDARGVDDEISGSLEPRRRGFECIDVVEALVPCAGLGFVRFDPADQFGPLALQRHVEDRDFALVKPRHQL